MDFQSQMHLPIAKLQPSIDSSRTSIKGVITIIWPFSSSKQTTSFLLVEPDFRLRQKKGQIRITFHGSSARAIAKSGLTSGDEIILRLEGATWLKNALQPSTPGRAVDWELEYGRRVVLKILRATGPPTVIDIDRSSLSPEPLPDLPLTPYSYDPTPVPRRIFQSPQEAGFWASPAFLKRKSLPASVLFTDQDLEGDSAWVDGRASKRTKFGRASGQWRFAESTASPEKTTTTPTPIHTEVAPYETDGIDEQVPVEETAEDADIEDIEEHAIGEGIIGEDSAEEDVVEEDITGEDSVDDDRVEDDMEGDAREEADSEMQEDIPLDPDLLGTTTRDDNLQTSWPEASHNISPMLQRVLESYTRDNDHIRQVNPTLGPETPEGLSESIVDNEKMAGYPNAEAHLPLSVEVAPDLNPTSPQSKNRKSASQHIDDDVDMQAIDENHVTEVDLAESSDEGSEDGSELGQSGSVSDAEINVMDEDIAALDEGADIAVTTRPKPVEVIEIWSSEEEEESEDSISDTGDGLDDRIPSEDPQCSEVQIQPARQGWANGSDRQSSVVEEYISGEEERPRIQEQLRMGYFKDDREYEDLNDRYLSDDESSGEDSVDEQPPGSEFQEYDGTVEAAPLTQGKEIELSTSQGDGTKRPLDDLLDPETIMPMLPLSPELSGLQKMAKDDTFMASREEASQEGENDEAAVERQLETPLATQIIASVTKEVTPKKVIHKIQDGSLPNTTDDQGLDRPESPDDSVTLSRARSIEHSSTSAVQTEDRADLPEPLTEGAISEDSPKAPTTIEEGPKISKADRPEVPTRSISTRSKTLDGAANISGLSIQSPAASNGFRTPLAYFSSLPSLKGKFASIVDVIAVVVQSTMPMRATKGPKHVFQTLLLVDPPSVSTSSDFTVVQLFRPVQNALPLVRYGDAILLRDFKVQSFKQKMSLVSTDSSAWAVFRKDRDPQIRGPPVEFGAKEKRYAGGFREWFASLESNTKVKLKADAAQEVESIEAGLTQSQVGQTEGARTRRQSALTKTKHVLRDGTTYVDGQDDNDHELRNGTVYRDSSR